MTIPPSFPRSIPGNLTYIRGFVFWTNLIYSSGIKLFGMGLVDFQPPSVSSSCFPMSCTWHPLGKHDKILEPAISSEELRVATDSAACHLPLAPAGAGEVYKTAWPHLSRVSGKGEKEQAMCKWNNTQEEEAEEFHQSIGTIVWIFFFYSGFVIDHKLLSATSIFCIVG